jgi:hypothetical protein
MLQADKSHTTIAKTIRRNAKRTHAPSRVLDPATIKERFYGLLLRGNCLEPVLKNGDRIVVDREGPLHAGCFAVFYHRPELVPPGELPLALKRLVTAVPPVTFPYREHPASEVTPVIIVEQLNPAKRWVVRCSELLAVHHCLGSADDPEVLRKLEAEGWRP